MKSQALYYLTLKNAKSLFIRLTPNKKHQNQKNDKIFPK